MTKLPLKATTLVLLLSPPLIFSVFWQTANQPVEVIFNHARKGLCGISLPFSKWLLNLEVIYVDDSLQSRDTVYTTGFVFFIYQPQPRGAYSRLYGPVQRIQFKRPREGRDNGAGVVV